MQHLTLFIPGLFEKKGLCGHLPPILSELLAKSRPIPVQYADFTRALFALFNLHYPATDCPAGAVSYRVDTGKCPESLCMRADPVHLVADHRGVSLMDQVLDLDQDDAQAVAGQVGDLFVARGLDLVIPVPNRWYILLKRPAAISTTAPEKILGHYIDRFLPTGQDALPWCQLLNDIQMGLYDAPINLQRRRCGKAPVNSLWFWGGGRLPEEIRAEWTGVYTDNILARGLASLSNTPILSLPTQIEELDYTQKGARHLVIISPGLPRVRESFLRDLDERWMRGLRALLISRRLTRLQLLTEQGQFLLSPRSMLKFWKRRFF